MKTKKLHILITILSMIIIVFNSKTTTFAKESVVKTNRSNIFAVTTEVPDIIEKYATEGELGIKYIDDRICVSVGNSLDVNIADYIYLKLDSNHTIPCIICDIHEESDGVIVNIYANTSRPFINLSDINEEWTSDIKEIGILDTNYMTTVREELSDYAQQFVGNPYVWGGESLTNGCDCSGFTLKIYEQYGISLPHDAEAQASYGYSVSESDLTYGDLIFYPDETGIGHVAIYIGGGQIVHASNSAPYPDGGIKISQYNYRDIACIRRLL